MKEPLSRKDFLSNVDSIIKRMISSRELSVALIANELNIQTQQLRRRIKSITGMSSIDYIAMHKINHAKKLLLDHDMLTIAKIGYLCGFDEPTHFSRFFRHYTGMTPGNYRKHPDKE